MKASGVTPEDSSRFPTIPGFRILRQIGRGGFSTVYAAVQSDMGREVAIKVLNAGFETERQQRTFERECEVMGMVSRHPGIVTVHLAVQTTDGRPGIVMELYQSTYRDRLRSLGPLPIDEGLDVGVRMADALQAVHDAKILHRDIKPHNIFIGAYGPALADFGISSITGERSITGGGGFSLDYSAPEVLGDADPGRGADVYALGATLYHLLSGEVPFPHKGAQEDRLRVTVGRIVSAPPPTLVRTDASDSLVRLVRRCMAKDVAQRPESGSKLADALRAVQREVGLNVTPSPTRRDREPSEPSEPGRAQEPSPDESVTIARTHAEARVDPPEESGSEVRAVAPSRRRGVLVVGGMLAAVVAAGVAGSIVLGKDGDNAASASSTSEAGSRLGNDTFEVLDEPGDLTAIAQEDGTVLVSWTATEDAAEYQVKLVGSASAPQLVSGTEMLWSDLPAGVAACFEVRSVSGGRISATAAGPACAG